MAVLTFFVRLKSFWRSSRGSLKRKRFETEEILREREIWGKGKVFGKERESDCIYSKKYASTETEIDTDTDTATDTDTHIDTGVNTEIDTDTDRDAQTPR